MRILLVDDHRLLLEGLSNLLDAHGLQVTGMAQDGLEAIRLAHSLRPDVILMDIRMPRCDGLTATRCIKAELPDVKIIMLTTSEDEADLFEAIKSGACGYLLKSMDAEGLIECLKQAEQDIPPFSRGLAIKLLSEFARLADRPHPSQEPEGNAPPMPASGLTERQVQVLTLVAQGDSYKEVGARLGLSPRTIKYHMSEIMQQLHLANRAQVLAYAARHKL